MYVEDPAKVTIRARKIAVIERILNSREHYTAREWGIVQLYYTCGLSQYEIARIFKVPRTSITRSMRNIRRKALSKRLPPALLVKGVRKLSHDKGASARGASSAPPETDAPREALQGIEIGKGSE